MSRPRHQWLILTFVSLLLTVMLPGRQMVSDAAGAFLTATTAATSTVDQTPTFQRIQMVSPTHGWAVITIPNPISGPSSSPGQLYRGPHGYVLHTQDGGQTWTAVNPPSLVDNADNELVTSFFLDDTQAWAVTANATGQGYSAITVWRSSDSGLSWQKGARPLTTDGFIGASFIDSAHGWLLLANGGYQNGTPAVLYQSLDGGMTWQLIADDGTTPNDGSGPISKPETGVTDGAMESIFTSALDGWLTSWSSWTPNGPGSYTLLHTTDGGKTWNAVSVATNSSQADVLYGCDVSNLYAYRPNLITLLALCSDGNYAANPQAYWYQGVDNGKSWQTTQLPANIIVAGPERSAVPALFMMNSTIGWLIGNDADTGPLCCGSPYDVPTLYQTVDAGKTWTKIAPLPDALKPPLGEIVPVLSFDFIDDHTGWVIDNSGGLLTTKDAGKTWSRLNPVFRLQ